MEENKKRIIKNVNVEISNCYYETNDTGLETIHCKQHVVIDHDHNFVSLHMTQPRIRNRNKKWFELHSKYGDTLVMSRKEGAVISLSLNDIPPQEFAAALQTLQRNVATCISVAYVKMSNKNIIS